MNIALKHLLRRSSFTAKRSLEWRIHGSCLFTSSARCLVTPPKPFHSDHFLSLDNQSVLLPGTERVRASRLTDDPYKFVTTLPNENVKTVYDMLDNGLQMSGDGDFLGTKNPKTGAYEWIKYSEAIRRIQHVGSGLVHLGLEPNSKQFVGAFASNRYEFTLIMFACAGYSMILVPLYDSLGAESVNYIINTVNFPVIFANSSKNALNILSNASKIPSSLKTLVIMDSPSAELISTISSTKLKLITFRELEEIGKLHKLHPVLPKPDDLFCIPYTSGTTGIPKGVMLTHSMFVTCIASLLRVYGPAGIYGGTIISYLPPGHIYEMVNQIGSAYFARRIAYYTDDIKKIFEEIRNMKPTVVPLVPRLMNAMYSRVKSHVDASKLKRFLVNLALSRKEKMIRKGIVSSNTMWDKFFFKKFQEALGGEAHIIISTSAPVSREVIRFFRCASGCYVFEAYGQTEALGGTMSFPYEADGGSVGAPFPCVHIKLADVPEMNYYSKDDVGEVCFKGPNVFLGYYKNEEQTKAAIDKDGWHHSGDIGKWLPNGTLKIIDRKKHLFKLSQGEYIAPEKVENTYSHSSLVLQVYVDGFSDKDYVVAVVVPEPDAFSSWLKTKGFASKKGDLLKDKEVRTAFLKELHKYGEKEGLNSLEQARNLFLTRQPMTIEKNLLTPTLKVKRAEARKYFKEVLGSLYAEGHLVKSLKNK